MKKTSLIALFAAACMVACDNNANDHNESNAEEHMEAAGHHTEAAAEAAADEAGDDWRRESGEMRTEWNRRIDENDAEIERLKAEAKLKKAEARADYEKEVGELKAKNERMRARMSDYKDDSNDNWRQFKEEFNRDMDELGNALKNLGKDNKK